MNTKSTLFFSLLVAGAFAIGGCNLLEKDLNFVIEKELSVNDTSNTFTGSDVIDALSANNEFKDNKSHIKSASIEKVTYYLSYFKGSATQTLEQGSVKIADKDGSNPVTLAELSNIRLMDVTKETELKTQTAGVDRATKLLLNEPFAAKIIWQAKINEKPVDLKVKTKFHVKVTVKP